MSSSSCRLTTILLLLLYTCTYELASVTSQSFVRYRSAGRSMARSSGDVFIPPPLSAIRHRSSHIRRQSPLLEAPPPPDNADTFDNWGRLISPANGAQSPPVSPDAGARPAVPPQDFHEQCQSDCRLHVTNLRQAQADFEDLTDDIHLASIVHFKVEIQPL